MENAMKKLRFILILCCIALCVCCIAAFSACGSNALDSPAGLKYDLTTQTVSWRAVPEARRYVISIKGNDKDSRQTSYSVSSLEPGD